MKLFLVVALVSLFLSGCFSQGSLRDNLLTGAHRCCSSACSVEELTHLRLQLDRYIAENKEDAYSMKEYLENSLSGKTCAASHAKRAPNAANVTLLSPGPFDVGTSSVEFKVKFVLTIDSGIYYSYIYASIYTSSGVSQSVYPSNYYYYDQYANATATLSKEVIFTLPKNSANGTWTINAYGYGVNYTQYTSTTKTFVILATINDNQKPKLTSVYAPVWNINDDSFAIYLTGTDDISGITSMTVYVQNATNTVAYGYWYSQYGPNGYIGVLNVNDGIVLNLYAGTAVGVYNFYIYVNDALGSSAYYYSSDLIALGFQSNITFAVGNCKAGRFRPYESTATTCTLCAQGTYSAFGAFRCKACKPGTASNIAGASQCTACPPGTSSVGGAIGCDPCPAGTYTYNSGRDTCTPCQPGYNSTEGSENCSPCPYGTYSNGGTATCTQCPAGTYGGYAAPFCLPCPPGQYTSLKGSQNCVKCAPGSYSYAGYTSCTACPANKPSSIPESNSVLNCY